MGYLSFILSPETADSAYKNQSNCANDSDVILCSIDDNYSTILHHHILYSLGKSNHIKRTIHCIGDCEDDSNRATKLRP